MNLPQRNEGKLFPLADDLLASPIQPCNFIAAAVSSSETVEDIFLIFPPFHFQEIHHPIFLSAPFSQQGQNLCHIRRKRRRKLKVLPGNRVGETQGGGMQGLARKFLKPLPESRRFDCRKPPSPSVGRVSQKRVADRGEMDPDLVRSSGFQPKLCEAKFREALQDFPVGSGLPPLPGPRRHLLPVPPGDGRLGNSPAPPRKAGRKQFPNIFCGRVHLKLFGQPRWVASFLAATKTPLVSLSSR